MGTFLTRLDSHALMYCQYILYVIHFPAMADEEKQAVHLLIEKPLLKRLDDFRFKGRFESRTDAIKWLLKAALDAKLAPKGE